MVRTTVLISISLLANSIAAFGEQRMINVGNRRLAVYCDGDAGSRSQTVILIPAGGSTAKDWEKVRPAVSTFARVCSYDHASHGASDKAPVAIQSVDEVVKDLHGWRCRLVLPGTPAGRPLSRREPELTSCLTDFPITPGKQPYQTSSTHS